MELQNPVSRPRWETWELNAEESAALVAAVRQYADETQADSAEWEAIQPVEGLFRDYSGAVPEIRLQVLVKPTE